MYFFCHVTLRLRLLREKRQLWGWQIFLLAKNCIFPGKGAGPGFSFSCRPSALTAPWIWGRGGFIVCMFTRFSECEVTFACIFTGFAESRPWECRVFSFKIARTSQKSRVFPFTFAPTCRQSHVLCVFLHVLYICVWFCAYVLQFVAGSSWVELIFECNFTVFLWECRVLSLTRGCAS